MRISDWRSDVCSSDLAQSGWPNAGGQLQPERRYPSPQGQQQPLEGMRLLQRRTQIAGLADIAGKFGTEAEALGHLAGPALDLLLRWPGVQRGIALDCIEGGTVGGKEIGSRSSRRVQRAEPGTLDQRGTNDAKGTLGHKEQLQP